MMGSCDYINSITIISNSNSNLSWSPQHIVIILMIRIITITTIMTILIILMIMMITITIATILLMANLILPPQ